MQWISVIRAQEIMWINHILIGRYSEKYPHNVYGKSYPQKRFVI